MACTLSSVNYHSVSAKMIRQAMRNIAIDSLDHTPRSVIAIGTDYPPDYLLPLHSHRRAQLLYGATGVMQVFTRQGNWVVPPQRAVWIPPQVAHEVRMMGVSTRSLYIEPDALIAPIAEVCQVVSVTPLMRQLLMAAVDMPLVYQQEGRMGLWWRCCCMRLPRCRHYRCIFPAGRSPAQHSVPGLFTPARRPRATRALGSQPVYEPAHL